MKLTVGELKQHLSVYDDDAEIEIDGGLTFYRLKKVGENILFLEFGEIQVMLSSDFRKMYPQIKVAFSSIGSDEPIMQEDII